jgi:hypothetical protein
MVLIIAGLVKEDPPQQSRSPKDNVKLANGTKTVQHPSRHSGQESVHRVSAPCPTRSAQSPNGVSGPSTDAASNVCRLAGKVVVRIPPGIPAARALPHRMRQNSGSKNHLIFTEEWRQSRVSKFGCESVSRTTNGRWGT